MSGILVTDIPTAVVHVEQEQLADLATGRTVLELGSHFGASTIVMARVAAWVHAVDNFSLDDALAAFYENLRRYAVLDRVVVHVGDFDHVVPSLKPGHFDFAFLDGDHDYEATSEQIVLAKSVLRAGSVMAFHDYHPATFPGVVKAVNKLGKPEVVGTLAWLTI